jgi:hypothetical protein
MAVSTSFRRLTYETLANFLRETRIVLLAAEIGGQPSVPETVVDFLTKTCGGDFGYGRIDLLGLPYLAWLDTFVHPVRPQFSAWGLYLFLDGKAARYHTGKHDLSYRWECAATLLGQTPPNFEFLHSQVILEHLGPAVTAYASSRPARPRAPEREEMSLEVAREMLEIGPHATDTEVERAWRRRRGELAPDKVQHVNAAFVRLAQDKVKELDRARAILRKA